MSAAMSSGEEEGEAPASDDDQQQRRKKKGHAREATAKSLAAVIESGSDSSDSDASAGDGDFGAPPPAKRRARGRPPGKRAAASAGHSSDDSGGDELDKIGKPKEFPDGFDENFCGGEDDRVRLEAMSEKEREEEIFKRIERREVLMARQKIQEKLDKEKERGDDDAKPQSSKSSAKRRRSSKKGSDGEESLAFEKPSDVRAKQSKNRAMEHLLAQREEKKKAADLAKRKQLLKLEDVFGTDEGDAARKSASSSSSSSSGSDSDSSRSPSPSRAAARYDSTEAKRQQISTADQLGRMRLSRWKLAKLVHAPFFAKTAVGCFVRIGIGANNAKPVYRVAQIVDVLETGKVYPVEKTRTNKGLRLSHGTDERVYRLEFVSNQDFTETEFTKWLETMKFQNLSLPTVEQSERKAADIKRAMNYNYSEEDIDKIVNEKNRFQRRPHNYAMRKTSLLKAKEVAEQNGNMEEVEKLRVELDELERRASELDRRRTAGITGISWINQRNRDKMKEAFLGGGGPSDVTTSAAAAAVASPAVAAAVAAGGADTDSDGDNCFLRKKSKSRMVTGPARGKGAGGDDASAADTTADGDSADETLPAYVPTTTTAALPKLKSPTLTDARSSDLFSAHDFDVEIDLKVPVVPTMATPVVRAVPKETATHRRSLNLDDYKRKRGLL